MYFPYFRGKQFELSTIRECAKIFSESNFTPIIEPVRQDIQSLEKTLQHLVDSGCNAIVVTNPQYGLLKDKHEAISDLLLEKFQNKKIHAGILLREADTVNNAIAQYRHLESLSPYFLHFGFNEPKKLSEELKRENIRAGHIFNDDTCKKMYRIHFKESFRVLISDGFKRQKNADYPPKEHFSELHITYKDEGMDGFGDFLIVGDEFSETGGPAYAVAIHLTTISKKNDDISFIYHFVSDNNLTPNNPAGKFYEALKKLVSASNNPDYEIEETSALQEFKDLYKKNHFPGLGIIKKISMKHHIEILHKYLKQ